MKKQFFLFVIAIAAAAGILFLVSGRKNINDSAGQTQGRARIVASFYPLYFFTKEIVGGGADVLNLIPSGAEPHDYELSTKDAADLERADLVILNGQLEPWADKIADEFIERGKPILAVTEGSPLESGTDKKGALYKDPHIWLSPRRAKAVVEKIASAASLIDPAGQSAYASNAKELLAKLDDLDAKFRKGLSACEQKVIIVSHAAFGYAAKDYLFAQVPITGLSPDSEPAAADLVEVTKFARERQIKYIFFESLASPRLAETIAKEVGARTLVLNPIEGLAPNEEKQGKNYFTEMEENLANLRTALECR